MFFLCQGYSLGKVFFSYNFFKSSKMLLKSKKAVHSQSRKGNPYDNALMEFFYRILKESLFKVQNLKLLNKLKKKFLNISNFIIMSKECILL